MQDLHSIVSQRVDKLRHGRPILSSLSARWIGQLRFYGSVP